MDTTDFDFEPMEVDKSASSSSKMDISYNDSINNIVDLTEEVKDHDDTKSSRKGPIKLVKRSPSTRILRKIKKEKISGLPRGNCSPNIKQKPSVKTYHIKMHRKQKKELFPFKIVISSLVFLLLASLAYTLVKFKCTDGIQLSQLRIKLTESIFGQSAAVNKIIEILNLRDKNKLLFLYGGTGVGKTFTVSLMLKDILHASNVYHYTMPTFKDTFSPELMLGLTFCDTTILVIDDLTISDDVTTAIQSVISKSKKLDKELTMILVYNCDYLSDNFVKRCDDQFHQELQDQFKDIDVEKHFVKFESLNEQHLRQCVDKELGSRKVSKQEMNNILKNFDVTLDGCKGVYTKIKFLNI